MEPSFDLELPDFSEITPDGQRLLLEWEVKHNGIWRIHKSDPDDVFPSDPHGDRVDGPEKLDLYTGRVYDVNSRKEIYIMPKKAMKYIYNQIIACKEKEIKDKLISKADQITYL
jgi:hypothetical protein